MSRTKRKFEHWIFDIEPEKYDRDGYITRGYYRDRKVKKFYKKLNSKRNRRFKLVD